MLIIGYSADIGYHLGDREAIRKTGAKPYACLVFVVGEDVRLSCGRGGMICFNQTVFVQGLSPGDCLALARNVVEDVCFWQVVRAPLTETGVISDSCASTVRMTL
jgi:hypothetical protein